MRYRELHKRLSMATDEQLDAEVLVYNTDEGVAYRAGFDVVTEHDDLATLDVGHILIWFPLSDGLDN